MMNKNERRIWVYNVASCRAMLSAALREQFERAGAGWAGLGREGG